ncbi:LOW QUALITY PROTEIN: enoyl-CoA hydratase domain-containing protein 3, mitochondrial-like [Pecten maximus]|uniref:LOW QUALITY PROTEIN: enoyl-CoA hydratase domain-containing protein 3, mitochondrial-like n=1 Tax=Pecten maximus TaxID=6579 RepID=UPI001458956F|nr:LOW QUALITY PROTEIN: enoyl-CoA hydratase domain-containing protein 3, mitochondrial-like [Pecten maximus]
MAANLRHRIIFTTVCIMMAGRLWNSRLLQITKLGRHFSTQRSRLWRPDNGYTITTEENGIRTICLNDPKKRNALSLRMLETLKTDLSHETDGLRVIILSAKGPVFSAGHDLKELTTKEGRDYHRKVFQTCTDVMLMVQELPVPVIAQVSGLATAAGCQLVASCDIAVATDTSRFATPGVSVGLFCSTPAVAVGRSVPRKVAMEMLFTGHPISAQDALLHGLVSRVVPEDKLEETTMAIANRICETSKSVVALGKATFYAQMNLERKEAYTLTSKVMVENLSLGDGQEGIRAFIEKRKPSWNHKTEKVH